MKVIKAITIILILMLGISMANSSTANPTTNVKSESVKKYYQVVFIWLKDPQKFNEYAGKMGPIVAKYGGKGERILSPIKSIYSGSTDLKQPDMINIVYYDSKEAYDSFTKDPEFLKIKHLRTESIDMAGIGGYVNGGELVSGGVKDRLYMLEFAYFKDGSSKAYNSYRKKSKDFYKKHGLFTERVFEPDNVFGNIKMPDRVSLFYHDNEMRKQQLQNDPAHEKIEGLYSDSISDLIWIEAKAAFVNMD